MGSWSFETFGNDDALDFAIEVQASRDLKLTEAALDWVLDEAPGFLPSPECSRALAASEILAAVDGQASEGLPDELRIWIKDIPRPPMSLASKARRVVCVIRERSELRDLVVEAGQLESWIATLRDLERRLQPQNE